MSQRLKVIVLREWNADRSSYIEVTLGRRGHMAWQYVLDRRKLQYRRKPKYRQRGGGWVGGMEGLRGMARYPSLYGSMWGTVLAMIEKAGLTSSVEEHPPRKRERAGSSPASGSGGWRQ